MTCQDKQHTIPKPVVLCFSGHDPTGGAGIQADIETIGSLGCHAATIITCLTAQDTRNVAALMPQTVKDFTRQTELLIADLPIAAIKIGLLGSAEIALACASFIRQLMPRPVVLDPILAAGGGTDLSSANLLDTLRRTLLPLVTVATPNSPEARRLAGQNDLDACARWILATGCGHVLITGTHETELRVTNRLYGVDDQSAQTWERLPHSYHGSGCTLAAAIAAGLAKGLSVRAAVETAQRFTWQSLEAAQAPGKGQSLPDRFSPYRSSR